MKNTIIALVVIIVVGVGGYFFIKGLNSGDAANQPAATAANDGSMVASSTTETVIGKSVEGRDITAYHFGTGDTELLFIGGIHGGYEWNTVLVAYELMDYLKASLTALPANVKVTVIPVLNPDGLNKTVGTSTRFAAADVPASQDLQIAGRFNAHTVDLNRNFDCDWQTTGKWQTKDVSGGSAAFSEPESAAVKNYVETSKPRAVVTWYSSAGGVFASSCHNGVLPETNTLTKKFADASGYPAYQSFNFYEITGDMVNWLAKQNIPAISVLLTNHTDTEWAKNQKGIDALLAYYAR
ncbi:MAG: M14 family zinc carboxypeptidase [bacterium]|nr:M14 family zinc carboxypeptidase [bacterium]